MELIQLWFQILGCLCVLLLVTSEDVQKQSNKTVTIAETSSDLGTHNSSGMIYGDYNRSLSTNVQKNIPSSYEDFCILNGKGSSYEIYHRYNCYIDKSSSGKWNFSELRKYISLINAFYSFKVQCEKGAKISLPYQSKSKNIVKLYVQDCILTDYYADFKNQELDTFPDVMEEYVLINVQYETSLRAFRENAVLKSSTQPSNLICGDEETLKIMIKRNTTLDIIHDVPIDMNRFAMLATELIENARLSTHKCVFKKLHTLENSYTIRNRHYANEMTEQKLYPELKTLNVSHSNIYYVPEQFKNWWIYFEALEYIDLSYNHIQDVRFPISLSGIWGKPIPNLTYDLTHNKVSQISVRLFERLIPNERIFVNIANNPFNCTCTDEMKEVLKYIQETDWNSVKYKRYQYFRDLRCHLPESIRGRRLKDLTVNDINCGFELMPVTVALSILSFFLIIFLIVILKYRREIRILFFTRFDVVLPCQPVELYEDKEFDAFVSYSNDDEGWVRELFEESKNERLAHLKFCMHQKDFIPGKTIFENIVKCVENSKHTMIVLSQNFLNSHFCMWEFQEAFQQSIVERKRHLIIILLEEIPEKDLPSDLKRCMKTFTYIRKDDNIFIDRLLYSLAYKGKKGNALKAKAEQVNLGYIDQKENV